MIQLLAWPQALGSLHTMLPSCAKLDPEVIAESAKRIGLQVQLVSIANWESMSDELILQSILPASITANDQIVVISEASFFKANPFAFFAGELSNFIQFHYLEYGECVVNGDVVMLVPIQKLIVLFHHDGYYSAIQFT